MGDKGRFIIAGFVATLVMTMVMYFGPPLLGQQPIDIGKFLGDNVYVGFDNELIARVSGLIIHFILGTIVFSLIFAYFLKSVLPGPALVQGIIWGVILYLLAQILVMPMMQMMKSGSFDMGMMFGGNVIGAGSIWSLATHVIYGMLLGFIATKRY